MVETERKHTGPFCRILDLEFLGKVTIVEENLLFVVAVSIACVQSIVIFAFEEEDKVLQRKNSIEAAVQLFWPMVSQLMEQVIYCAIKFDFFIVKVVGYHIISAKEQTIL